MRVVHIATAFPRTPEDPITPWLVQLLRELRGRGIDASVLAPAYRGGPAREPWDIPVHRFRYAPERLETLTHDASVPDRLRTAPHTAALVPAYLAAGIRAASRLGRTRPDLVHVHWPMPHALLGAAMRRASGGHTAVVCTFYSVELNWVDRRLPWLRPFLRWTIRTADAVTAISRSTAATVREIGGREAAVIPYGAAVPSARGGGRDGDADGTGDTRQDGRPPAARPSLAAGDGPLRLLFVGRLVERKGVEVLVEALARIRTQREAVLAIVGEGEREESIRRTAEAHGVASSVRLAGRLPAEALAREYATCDIFVLPAVVDARGDTEGLGVVLLEALAYERPVVASATGGIPDIVESGHTGWLVPPGDAEALASTLLRVASDPVRAREVARRGRVMAQERFGWDRVLDATLQTYNEALRARRAGSAQDA